MSTTKWKVEKSRNSDLDLELKAKIKFSEILKCDDTSFTIYLHHYCKLTLLHQLEPVL